MPIKIPSGLPARKTLESEGVLLIGEERAARQDIRPMRVAILNLMPEKIKTETQLARVLGSSPLQVEMTLVALETHKPKTTSEQHLLDFYHPFSTIEDQKFDGLIITGAPIEKLPFEEVRYWDELSRIFDWALTHVHSSFNLCWGAQAALHHYYGIPKYLLDGKRFGVYDHQVLDHTSLLMHGLNDVIAVPVSRHTENRRPDFEPFPQLQILMESDDAGISMVLDHEKRHVHMFNHLEYDAGTLGDEYQRDVAKGSAIDVPAHYYPDDNPAKQPASRWRSSGHLLYGNWLNMIYQTTPYHTDDIGK
jgi:homoserine O-succinyltransferase/O-acetyltransferase